jgi:hypothetical protein
MFEYDDADRIDLETLLDDARAIVAGESDQVPTALHLWAALKVADGYAATEPPPSAFGQLRLPLSAH